MGKQAEYLLRVSNISAFATRDQLLTLFSSFGRVEGYKIIMQGTPSAVPTAVVQGVSTILNLLPPVEDSEKATQEAYFRYKRDKYVNAARYLSDILFLDKNIQCDAVPIDSLKEKGIFLDVLKRGEDLKYKPQESPPPEHYRHYHVGRHNHGRYYEERRGYYERDHSTRGYHARDFHRSEESRQHRREESRHHRRSGDDYDEGRDRKRRRIHYP